MFRDIRAGTFALLGFLLIYCGCAGKHESNLGFHKPKCARAPAGMMARIESAGDAFSYPNANSIIIETVDSTIFTENGGAVFYNFAITKPITVKGLKDESVMHLGFDTLLTSIEILYAAVIHPDSTMEFVPDTAIVEQNASGGVAEIDIYLPNIREKVVHFPQLNNGDAVVYSIKYNMLKPLFTGVISNSSFFQSYDPIHKNRSVSLIPKSQADKIQHKVFNDRNGVVKFSEYDTDEHHVFVWEADSVPALVPESGLPPLNLVLPVAMFANVGWKDLSRKGWEINEEMMKITDPELKSTVQALVETCRTEYDTIRAIGIWVAQELRYVGVSMGIKEYVAPHDVNQTFKDGFGVCRDVSALCVAMLRKAGIDAYNVYTDITAHKIYGIATPAFQHQVVFVKMKNGEEIFIDVTDDICRDLMPGYYSKKPYLILTKDGDDLKYHPLYAAEKNLGKIEAVSKIDGGGNLTSTVTITGKGLYDEILRQLGQYLEPEDQKRFFRRLINEIDPNAILLDFSIEPDPVKQLSIPAKLTLKYKVAEFAVAAGDFMLLSVPNATHIFDILTTTLSENLKLEKRNYDLRFLYTYGVDAHETIQLQKAYEAKSIPENAVVNNKQLTYSMNYDIEGKVVDFRYSLRLTDIDIPLRNYGDFRDAFTQYQNAAKGMLILSKETQ